MILEIIGICILNEVVKSIGNVGKSVCNIAKKLGEEYFCDDYDETEILENFYTDEYCAEGNFDDEKFSC